MNHCLGLVTLLLVSAGTTAAQEQPDFSGTWLLDTTLLSSARYVWGQHRPDRLVLNQTPESLVVSTGAESIVGAPRDLVFRLDGAPITEEDTSLGEIPNFKRQIRTEARWNGSVLETLTTLFAVTSDGVVPGGITRVLTFSFPPGGSGSLRLVRTGFRELPPAMLHGVPYRQEDDLVYARDQATYVRAAR